MTFSLLHQRGSSLIEILVTVLIFAIGMLGMAALQLSALRSTSDSSQRSQAIWLVQDLTERMRANPSGSAAAYASAPDCTALPSNQCASRYNPATSTVISASVCNPSQMAAFDRWEAQCSYAALAPYANNNGRANSRDFVSTRDDGSALFTVAANGSIAQISARVGSKFRQTAGTSNIASNNDIPIIEVQR